MPYLAGGDPSGVPVLLVHAVGDSQRIFEDLLDQLPSVVRAIAPTLRGHGRAGRPRSGYRSRDFAADLAAFMDVLGVEKAVIAGASSGGLVAQRLALDFADRVLGLVLLGAPLALGSKAFAQELWASTIAKLADPVDPDFVRGFVESTLSRPAEDARLDVLVGESLMVPAAVWKATIKGILDDDFSAELGRIAVPTLVVWGDRDTILSREDQETLARLIPGARLLVYPGAGHLFYWEDPSRVAADLTAFVEKLAGRGRR